MLIIVDASVIEVSHTLVHNHTGSTTLSLSNHGIGDTKSPGITQPLPNDAFPLSVMHTSSLSVRRKHIAKEYCAKLWLACAGIYRRGCQWEGAHAAVQDALLCDVCHKEVFTEVLTLTLPYSQVAGEHLP
jgi:hypothetical protein